MVEVVERGGQLVLNVLGTHRFWAFKNSITLDRSSIRSVRRWDRSVRPAWFRCPGTAIPWLFIAGTYYAPGRKEFWDTRLGDRAIVLDLQHAPYTRIVVDVENPQALINTLQSGS